MKPTIRFVPRLSCAIAIVLAGSAQAQVTSEQPPLQHTAPEMVDTLHGLFGDHHARAIHTKGIMLSGSFKPAPSAASVSSAPHLQKTSVPVLVRFSNFAGVPALPDTDGLASPRGLAVRFELPDGTTTDLVTHSYNGFPSRNADEFRELLQAITASGPTAPKPTVLDTYFAGHPIAKTFLTSEKPAPVSYGALPYYGVNAFKFTNAAGKVTYGRYQIVPVGAAQYLTDAQAKEQAPDYLSEEILEHVKKSPVKLKLLLQVAGAGDAVDDPSVAWPDSREKIELGVFTITKAVPDEDMAQKKIVFMPNSLPKGIAVEDQMVNFRSAAYAVSYGQRR